MAQNYMMGAGMVPPTAPTPPSQLSFKSDPNQRMQFKSFMQGLSAPQAPMAPPMAPQMMPMPQIPVPMQNIDVFSQPVQNMANGGRASRPQDRAKRAEEGRALAKRIFSKPKREKDDDDRSRGFPSARRTVKITPQQEADAAKEYLKAISGPKVTSDRFQDRANQIFSQTGGTDPNVPDLAYDPMREALGSLSPRQSGLGSTLSEQISALRGDPYGDAIDSLNQASDIFGDDDISGGKSFFPVTNVPQDITALDPNALSRFGQFLGTDRFYDGQIGQLQEFASIPGSQYDYDTGGGIAQAGQGTLTMSPSGVVTYDGPRDANYTGPFENLINPRTRPEREVNPCPPGYTLVNGACMPISQPIAQATPATPAPNVISNIPVTTAAPSPVVQSTAPPAQLGMPLGQPSPIQPMSQFLTNIPNSLNLAANNFLSSLSS